MLDKHGLQPLADRLDVRRVSAFDAAAAAAPVLLLDEHFRSVPHLIEFSAGRFYEQRIHLATRHPRNEQRDAIDVVHVEGSRDRHGVNADEVDACVPLVRAAGDQGARSIGVISPFRAQADALEQALLDGFSVGEIERLGLRVGTVHSFQGNEHDVMIVSLALSDDDPPASRAFAEDPNLFNVMVTRARQRMIVVTSLQADPGGLVGKYFAHAEQPPEPEVAGTSGTWARMLSEELERAGLPVRNGYPAGRWIADLCVGEAEEAVVLECAVHPDGSGTHLERYRALRRADWSIEEAFPTRCGSDPVRAAVTLLVELDRVVTSVPGR